MYLIVPLALKVCNCYEINTKLFKFSNHIDTVDMTQRKSPFNSLKTYSYKLEQFQHFKTQSISTSTLPQACACFWLWPEKVNTHIFLLFITLQGPN